jgi:hypothetical protein
MVEVLQRAVADRQVGARLPTEVTVDGFALRLRPIDVRRAQTAARRAERLHNLARPVFARRVVDLLTRRYAERIGMGIDGGADLLDREDTAALRREVAEEPAVGCWSTTCGRCSPPSDCSPSCSPTRPASPPPPRAGTTRRARCCTGLSCSHPAAWTPADVPLLEEAEELLGFDDSAQRARAERDRRGGWPRRRRPSTCCTARAPSTSRTSTWRPRCSAPAT